MRGKLSIPEPRTWFPAELNSTKPFPPLSLSLALSLERPRNSPKIKANPMKSFTRLLYRMKRLTSSKFSYFSLFDYFFGLKNLGKSNESWFRRCDWCQNFIESEPLVVVAYSLVAFFDIYRSLWTQTIVQARSFNQSFLWPFWEISTYQSCFRRCDLWLTSWHVKYVQA